MKLLKHPVIVGADFAELQTAVDEVIAMTAALKEAEAAAKTAKRGLIAKSNRRDQKCPEGETPRSWERLRQDRSLHFAFCGQSWFLALWALNGVNADLQERTENYRSAVAAAGTGAPATSMHNAIACDMLARNTLKLLKEQQEAWSREEFQQHSHIDHIVAEFRGLERNWTLKFKMNDGSYSYFQNRMDLHSSPMRPGMPCMTLWEAENACLTFVEERKKLGLGYHVELFNLKNNETAKTYYSGGPDYPHVECKTLKIEPL